MKRILAVLLCLAMIFTVTACKPDNITYPTDILEPDNDSGDLDVPADQPETPAAGEESVETDLPAEEETEQEPGAEQEHSEEPNPEDTQTQEPAADGAAEETETPADDTETVADGSETATEEPAEGTEETADEQPAEGEEQPETEEEQPAEGEEEPEEEKAPQNPLAAADYKPATGATPTLALSGLIKPGTAVSALKNRTIVLYTADDQPAFSYLDETGKTVTEWDWMSKIAAENGFIMKYSIKSEAVSLKAQRIALYAGKKLSLVQLGVDDLAAGLTLAGSAADHLDTAMNTFGISKAVLEQSGNRLFAPVGNVESLWYNTALMPAETDPQALSKTNAWTVEEFKAICSEMPAKNALPLIMQDTLAWATLSGKSPLTLANDKLDSNINARATRAVWSAIKELDLKALTTTEDNTSRSLKDNTAAFEYTAAPETAEGITLKWAPLPSMEKETAGTVVFTGTFMALPKYETEEEPIHAALTFAELWCNRYTEARAAALQSLGVSAADYQEYCNFAEANGQLILRDREILATVATYLSGLTDPEVNMDDAYAEVTDRVKALIAARNLYY